MRTIFTEMWSSQLDQNPMDDFMIRAIAAGIGVALVAAPLGAFVVWRRMAYFGDTLAHSALLGLALGFLLDVNLNVAILALTVIIALVLLMLQSNRLLATDTLLGILAHSTLSVGLVVMACLVTFWLSARSISGGSGAVGCWYWPH